MTDSKIAVLFCIDRTAILVCCRESWGHEIQPTGATEPTWHRSASYPDALDSALGLAATRHGGIDRFFSSPCQTSEPEA